MVMVLFSVRYISCMEDIEMSDSGLNIPTQENFLNRKRGRSNALEQQKTKNSRRISTEECRQLFKCVLTDPLLDDAKYKNYLIQSNDSKNLLNVVLSAYAAKNTALPLAVKKEIIIYGLHVRKLYAQDYRVPKIDDLLQQGTFQDLIEKASQSMADL